MKCFFGFSSAGVGSDVAALEWMSSMRPLMYFVVTCGWVSVVAARMGRRQRRKERWRNV